MAPALGTASSTAQRQWSQQAMQVALKHLAHSVTPGTTDTDLEDQLRRVPVRKLREALGWLGVDVSGCVEKEELLEHLLKASAKELAEDSVAKMSSEPAIPCGRAVRLCFLQNAPALNMQRATVVRYDTAADRYEVRLDWDGSVKRVRFENLEEEDDTSNREGAGVNVDEAENYPPKGGGANAAGGTEAHGGSSSSSSSSSNSNNSMAPPTHPEEPLSLRTDFSDAPSIDPAANEALINDDAAQMCFSMEDNAKPGPPSCEDEAFLAHVFEPPANSPSSNPAPSVAASPAPMLAASWVPAAAPDTVPPALQTSESPTAQVESLSPAAEAASEKEPPTLPGTVLPGTPPKISPETPASPSSCDGGKRRGSGAGLFASPAGSGAGSAKKPLRLRVGYGVGRQAEQAPRMAEGLRLLWQTREFCDVVLKCSGVTFRAHKAVLAGQSATLREMFRDGRTEIALTDLSHPEAVQLFLDFLYEIDPEEGYGPSTWEVNMDVLHAAHIFGMPSLKRQAAAFMSQRLTTQNSAACLAACEEYSLQDLRECILGHLATNKRALAEITGSVDMTERPELLREILRRVAETREGAPAGKRPRR